MVVALFFIIFMLFIVIIYYYKVLNDKLKEAFTVMSKQNEETFETILELVNLDLVIAKAVVPDKQIEGGKDTEVVIIESTQEAKAKPNRPAKGSPEAKARMAKIREAKKLKKEQGVK